MALFFRGRMYFPARWQTAPGAVQGEEQTSAMMGEGNSRKDVLARVQKAFAYAFAIDPAAVTVDTTPTDIQGWSSLGHLRLVSSLERTFGLTFDGDDLMRMENVKEILRIVQSKLEQVPRGRLK